MKSEIKKKGVRKINSIMMSPFLLGKKYKEAIKKVVSHYRKFYNIDLLDGEYMSGNI